MQVTYNNALDVWEQIKNVVPEDTAKSFGPVLNPMVWNEYGKNEEITSLIETLIHEINENLELNNISLEEKKSKTKKVGGREFVITKTANRIKGGKGGKKQVAIKFEDKVVDIPKFTYKNAIKLWGDFRIKRHIMNIIHDVDFQNQLESLMAHSWDKYGKNIIVTKAIDSKIKKINDALGYKNTRIKSGKFSQKVKKLKFKVGDFITLKEPDKKFHTEKYFYEIVKIENLYHIDENREQTNNYSENYICKSYLKETGELDPNWKSDNICIATVAQNKYKLYKPTTKTSNEPKVIDFKPGVEKPTKKTKVRDWYVKAYPDDELKDQISDVTFAQMMQMLKNGINTYPYIAEDSVVRERVFEVLADLYFDGDYEKVYNLWLRQNDIRAEAEAKKTSKKAKTPKAPKVAKPSYKKAPYWYQILQKFKNMAGKEHKTTSSIQAFLTFLQDSCNAKLNRTTPYIEIIRKIQDVVFPYANRLDTTYQDLPKWESLVNECKEAMSTITISKKTGVDPKFETVTLSGHKSKSKKKSKKCK